MGKLNSLSNWNAIYIKGQQLSIWPWSDVVALVYKYTQIETKRLDVLELGCGAGANIPFFLANNANYTGIDGSKFIINKLRKNYPNLSNNLFQYDFTKGIKTDKKFDIILDRAALTLNSTELIKSTLQLIGARLKTQGVFIGIDWYSTKHSSYLNSGQFLYKDKFTKTKFRTGQFTEVGVVHFSDRKHILDLFNEYEIINLSHKIISQYIPLKDEILATWNIVAKKTKPDLIIFNNQS